MAIQLNPGYMEAHESLIREYALLLYADHDKSVLKDLNQANTVLWKLDRARAEALHNEIRDLYRLGNN